MDEMITQTIQSVLDDAVVHVESPDGVHYQAVVISEQFTGMPLVRQHQLVMNALKASFDSDRLHALQLKTMTPAKWQAFSEQQQ